jgi:glycosyltransferase involved in cell wall biosynthesis
MRVHVVDPSAYTPPYDHALCRALGAAGVEVELFTSRFAYGSVPPPEGYERREIFYRLAHRGATTEAGRHAPSTEAGRHWPSARIPVSASRRSRVRMALKLAEHVPDMLRYRHAARAADVVHFQWLTVQPLDVHLLPRRRRTAVGVRPKLVLTAHDVLPREPRPGQLAAQRRLYERFDAVVVHSEHGRERLVRELGVARERVHVIPHGALTHLADRSRETHAFGSRPRFGQPAESPAGGPPFQTDGPVVLCFGLLRPYKGLDVLVEAWRGVEGPPAHAELWIVGMPRMDISALRRTAPANVRFVPRFVPDAELPAYFRRADLVVLPYLQADQSGVLATALAFGKPLLLSDVGGFPEIAATGAARTVPAGDLDALRDALQELLRDPAALSVMAERARAAAAGPYSWDAVARQTLDLYRSLAAGS